MFIILHMFIIHLSPYTLQFLKQITLPLRYSLNTTVGFGAAVDYDGSKINVQESRHFKGDKQASVESEQPCFAYLIFLKVC